MRKRQMQEYERESEPIVLTKPFMDLVLKQENPADLIALYTFYYYTAKWQRTNQPRATNTFVMKGLGWGKQRFYNAKKQLLALDLIENRKMKSDKDGKIETHYILVKHILTAEKAKQIQNNKNPEYENIHSVDNRDGGFPYTMETQNANALSSVRGNALSSVRGNALSSGKGNASSKNKKTVSDRNKEYKPLARKLSNIIQTQKNIKHTPTQLKGWADEIRKLVENNDVSKERIENALDWYEENIGGQYIPVIESGKSLRDKFIKLESAIDRESKKTGGHKEYNKNYSW